MIHFNCEHCGQEFSVFDKVGGKFGRCKVCGGKMKIPEANSANTRETYEAEAVVHVEDGQGHAIGGEELAPGGVDRFMEEARQIIYLYGGTTPECLMRLTSLAERYGMDSKEMNVAVVALAKNPDTQTPPKNQEAVAEKTSKDKATGGKPKRLKAFGEAVEAHVRGNMMTEVMVEELVLIGTLRHGLSEQQVRAEIDKAFELSGAKVIDEAAAIAYMNGVVDELMEGELYVSDKLRQRFYKLGNEVGLAQFLIDEIVLDRFNPVRLSKKVYREIALISGLVVAGVLLMVLIFSGTWGGDSDKASNARVPISDPFKTHGRPVVHREALNEEQWPTEMIRFDIQAYAQLIGGVGAWSTSLLEDDVTGRGAVGYPGMWAAVEKELADAKKTERLARLTLLVAHVYISEPDEILVTRLRDQLISKLAEAVEGDGASNPGGASSEVWGRIYGHAFWAVEVCAVVMTDDVVSPNRATEMSKEAGRYLERVVYEPHEKSNVVAQRMASELARVLAQRVIDGIGSADGGAATRLARFEGLSPYLARYLGADERTAFENKLARVVLDTKTLEELPGDTDLVGVLQNSDIQKQLDQIVQAYGGSLDSDQDLEGVGQLTELLGRLMGTDSGIQKPEDPAGPTSTTPASGIAQPAEQASNLPATAAKQIQNAQPSASLLRLTGDARRTLSQLTHDTKNIERLLEESVVMAHVSMGLIGFHEGREVDASLARSMGLKAMAGPRGGARTNSEEAAQDRLRQIASVLTVWGDHLKRDRLSALNLIVKSQDTTSLQPISHTVARYLLAAPYDEYADARQTIFKLQSSANVLSALADTIGSVKGLTKERVEQLLMSVGSTQISLRNNWLRESQQLFRKRALLLIDNGDAVGPQAVSAVDDDSVWNWHDLLADVYYEQARLLGVHETELGEGTAPALMLASMINEQLKTLRQSGQPSGRVGEKLQWILQLHEGGEMMQTPESGGDSVSDLVRHQRVWAGLLEVEVWMRHPERGQDAEQLIRDLDEQNSSAGTLIEQMRNSERAIMGMWVLLAGG